MKITIFISIACFGAILIQYIAYYSFGQYITWFIPVFSLGFESYSNALSESALFRPSGFFGEPASLVWYICPVLNYTLSQLVKDFTFKKLIYVILFSVSIILCKSLFGILFLAVLWGIWALKLISLKKNASISNLLLLILLPFIIILTLRSSIVQEALMRIDFSDLENSLSFSGRFLQYDIYNSFNSIQMIFGVGIGNLMGTENINNAFAYILTGGGIISIILLMIIYIFMFKYTKNYSAKVLLLCTIIMNFGSNALLSTSLIFYVSYIHVYNKLDCDKINQTLESYNEVRI